MLPQMHIVDCDPELSQAIAKENERQENHIELIASENYTSTAVMEAQGSALTNKYAEGYPGKRYYGGCEHVDTTETLAIERAKTLFNAKYANVQPHSGSQANSAAYMALLKAGDSILGMDLNDGGHLTHGSPVSFSGRIYNATLYGLDAATGEIDYNQIEDLAKKHKPKVIVAGFSAYSRIIKWDLFREIADRTGAKVLADMAHVSGLIAAGIYPSPIPHAHVVTSTTHKTLAGPRGGIILSGLDDAELHKKLNFAVFPESQGGPLCHIIAAKAVCFKEAMTDDFVTYQTQVVKNAKAMTNTMIERGLAIVGGGTDNHLFLVDLTKKEYTGKDAEHTLNQANITANKNTVPGEQRSPFITSGLRIGTPAITRRGFLESHASDLAHWICDILDDIHNEETIYSVKSKVLEVCSNLPVYRK